MSDLFSLLRKFRRRFFFVSLFCLWALASSCGPQKLDPSTASGREAIYDTVNGYLSREQCAEAIDAITPLYESIYSNDQARYLYAASYACKAGFNYFEFTDYLLENSAAFSTNEIWERLTLLYPSVTGDGKSEGLWFATDALFAILGSGVAVPAIYKINATTNNPGSLQPNDRDSNSNAYLAFLSMALVGTGHNRFGSPYSNGKKGADLPWNTHDNMTTEGCAHAGATVNMLDGIHAMSTLVTGSIATTMASIYSVYNIAITGACSRGCQGLDDLGAAFDPDCTFSAAECTACPLEIRNATACLATTKARCSAAGVVRFLNDNILGWQDGP